MEDNCKARLFKEFKTVIQEFEEGTIEEQTEALIDFAGALQEEELTDIGEELSSVYSIVTIGQEPVEEDLNELNRNLFVALFEVFGNEQSITEEKIDELLSYLNNLTAALEEAYSAASLKEELLCQ